MPKNEDEKLRILTTFGLRSFLFFTGTGKAGLPREEQKEDMEGRKMEKTAPTSVVVVTDCSDENAVMRQESRLATLFPGAHVSVCGARDDAAIALNVVDACDAILGSSNPKASGVVIANGAPRNEEQPNGSRFGWCELHNGDQRVLLIGTVDGPALSLLQEIKGVLDLRVFETMSVVPWLGLPTRLFRPQFRSYEIVPTVAWYLAFGGEIPSCPLDRSIPQLPYPQIAWIDSFGNCKTTFLARDVPWMHPGDEVGVAIDTGNDPFAVTCYDTIADAPIGALAIVVGSSGLGDRDTRFLELIIKMGNFAENLGLIVGTPITLMRPA